jgi:exopolysaccharide biosynthesis WecB/TagA/CpsF family protein
VSTEFLGLSFDRLTADQTVRWLAGVRAEDRFTYIVTPNVDHVVRLDAIGRSGEAGQELWRAYEQATLRLCDSRVLARVASLCGVPLTVVPGSDLTVRLFAEVAQAGDVIAIVGGEAALLHDLQGRFPALEFRQHIPPMGMRHDPAAMDAAANFVASSRARFTFLAVGSPQQELLAVRIVDRGGAGGCALCVGASIDFIVGRQRRAPQWLQGMGLEWSYRLAQEPRRMWRRYLVEGPRIFRLAMAWRRRRAGR